MTRLIFQIIGIVLLVGYLLSAGFLYGIGGEAPRYRGIDVHIADSTEAQFLSSRDIIRQISKAHIQVQGQTYDAVDTHQLSQMLEENKIIRRAYCYHTPDSMLRIDVHQRRPFMRIKSSSTVVDGNQRLNDFYLDRDGQLMPYEYGASSPTPLPLVTGTVSLARAREDLYRLALYLDDNRFWRDMITQCYMHPNGDVEFATRIGTTTILIGQIDEGFERRMGNVRKFYQKVMPRKGWNAYTRINAKFQGRIYGEKHS